MIQLMHLMLGILTVLQEASGEPKAGKLAVAYVICNRARQRGQSISDVVLSPYQFSAWNTESPTRTNLDKHQEGVLGECLHAFTAAYWMLEPDPTRGAQYYLRWDINKPTWWTLDCDPASEVRIGDHLFRRAKTQAV